MATSGTYSFNPALGDVVLNAYALAQVKRTALVAQHMADARTQSNMLLSEWSNRQVNLWTVELIETPLLEGVATYAVDPNIVMILDAYIRIDNGGGSLQDRVIMPISRTDYASYPNKELQGFPTVFWFNRLINPTITLWAVPNEDDYFTLRYYACRQIQDAELANGLNLEIPYRWLDAFTTGLAWRLSLIHNPEVSDRLEKLMNRSWEIAAGQDTENVPIAIVPGLNSYYRYR